MRELVRIRFGSHLYGTSTPSSDLDYKSVYMPSARTILLQDVTPTVSNKRPKAEAEKNYAGEIDEESHSIQRFLGLAAEGQTVALDVLFAPEWSMVSPPAEEWREVVANRARLLTKRSAAFIGYCRAQANKYGIKGSRIAAARAALRLLEAALGEHGAQAKLGRAEDEIRAVVAVTEHMEVVGIEEKSGAKTDFWSVCGRKLAFTGSVKLAHEIVSRLVSEYGRRALQAESQEGVDWKAMSHAVRVGRQAIELFQTSNINFPLPCAAHLMEIKAGRLSYEIVSREIEDLLVAIDVAGAASALPDEADAEWIDDFVVRCHRAEVLR